MRARILLVVGVALLVFGACSAERAEPMDVTPTGGPEINADSVAEHARQFDEDLSDRRPGSQQEFAAATYLLAHLQAAGYVVELDYVPVEDLVRSTNVVAAAPGGEPDLVVVAAYDQGVPGDVLGLFLELARVMRVQDTKHRVEFVALGAESARVEGGLLGSRRLAQRLIDEDAEPVVVDLEGAVDGGLSFYGDEAEEFASAAGLSADPGSGSDPVWDRAGFNYVVLSGDPLEVGDALLKYLEEAAG